MTQIGCLSAGAAVPQILTDRWNSRLSRKELQRPSHRVAAASGSRDNSNLLALFSYFCAASVCPDDTSSLMIYHRASCIQRTGSGLAQIRDHFSVTRCEGARDASTSKMMPNFMSMR